MPFELNKVMIRHVGRASDFHNMIQLTPRDLFHHFEQVTALAQMRMSSTADISTI